MLNFIPMKRKVTLYRQTGANDAWGQPTRIKLGTYPCQIVANPNLAGIQQGAGQQQIVGSTLVIHGAVNVKVGDHAEFTVANLDKTQYIVHSVLYLDDLGGKIIGTEVVVGNGKRS